MQSFMLLVFICYYFVSITFHFDIKLFFVDNDYFVKEAS